MAKEMADAVNSASLTSFKKKLRQLLNFSAPISLEIRILPDSERPVVMHQGVWVKCIFHNYSWG